MAAPGAQGDGAFLLFSSVRYDAGLRAATGNPAFAHAGWNHTHASCYYTLDFHRDRLLRAATHWGWDAAVQAVAGEAGLRTLEAVLDGAVAARAGAGQDTEGGRGPFRCRITLSQDGEIGCEVSGATETPLAALFPPRLPEPGFMTSGPDAAADGGREAGNGISDNSLYLLLQLCSAMGAVPYDVALDVDTTVSSPYTHYKTTRRQMYDAARQRAGITRPELHKEVLLVNSDRGVVMDGSISTVYFWRNGRWVTPPVPPKYGSESGSGGLDGTSRRWALERQLAVEEEIAADSVQHGEECWLSNGVRGFLYGKVRLR